MIKNMLVAFTAALRERKGVSALEYGIPAAAILGVIGTAATLMGTDLAAIFLKITSALGVAAS